MAAPHGNATPVILLLVLLVSSCNIALNEAFSFGAVPRRGTCVLSAAPATTATAKKGGTECACLSSGKWSSGSASRSAAWGVVSTGCRGGPFSSTLLSASEDGAGAGAEGAGEATVADPKEGEGEGGEEAKEEVKEEKPDPNAEVKAKIAELQKQVDAATRDVDKARTDVDLNGQSGYMSLAAEVANYRRKRTDDRSSLEASAMSGVMKSFNTVFEDFEGAVGVLGEATTEDQQRLHASYQGLYRNLLDGFKKLGMSKFEAKPGDKFNMWRHEKVGEDVEHPTIGKGKIIECHREGMEVNTRVSREARVVVSSGNDAERQAEEEAKVAKEAEDKAKAEAEAAEAAAGPAGGGGEGEAEGAAGAEQPIQA